MATKKPAKLTAFQQSIKDAERRAKRKVHRLEKRGIKTATIEPNFTPLDQLTPAQRRAYKNQLEKFVSRQTRFHAGAEGVPISHNIVQQIKQAERAANKIREKRWKTVADKPLLVQGAAQTAAQARENLDHYNPKTDQYTPNTRSPLYFTQPHVRDIAHIRSEKDAKAYVKKLKRSGSKKHQTEMDRRLRQNAAQRALEMNDPELAKRIKKLSLDQIYQLSTRSDFMQITFYYPTDTAEIHGATSHLNRLIDRVSGIERLKHPLEFDAVRE